MAYSVGLLGKSVIAVRVKPRIEILVGKTNVESASVVAWAALISVAPPAAANVTVVVVLTVGLSPAPYVVALVATG